MSKAKKAVDSLQKLGQLLGGTHAERMARAAEQGFSTGYYHGTNRDIQALRPNNGMVWLSDEPELANTFTGGGRRNKGRNTGKNGDVVYPVMTRAQSILDLGDMTTGDRVSVADVLERAGLPADDATLVALGQRNLDSGFTGVSSAISSPAEFLAETYRTPRYPLHEVLDNKGLQESLRAAKFDAVKTTEDGIGALGVFDPGYIRSVNADFNPANADSPDLLASVSGAVPYVAVGALAAGALAPEQAQAYDDYIRDEMEANTAADTFLQMRGQKSGFWEARRQDLLDMVDSIGGFAENVAFPAIDKPLQGYLALAGVGGALAQGQGLDQALAQGAQIARQPSEQTTYNMGGAVTDAVSPYVSPEAAALAGALTHTGIQMGSPF
jgi:hypothetical protein